MIRIILAEHDDAARSAFRLMLGAEPDLEVVGEAAERRAAMDLCRELLPDILVVDEQLPGESPLEAMASELARYGDAIGVLLLLAYDSRWRTGPVAPRVYGIAKYAPAEELIAAMFSLAGGE